LASEDKAEVLAFLASRPIHTVIMASMIRDNGLVSRLNRGTFYACYDRQGQLEGVALIGHVTMVETNNDAALAIFAGLAQQNHRAHVILGEQEKVERFSQLYSPGGQSTRLMHRELLLEQRWPVAVKQAVNMRRATLADLDLLVPVHAQMAFDESGINPLSTDPTGFRQRIARRIEQGRVWVHTEQGQLIFKADVVSETPEAMYLEGIYVTAEERGKGLGPCYVSQLSRTLLQTTQAVCLLVNEEDHAARSCYNKAGYKQRAHYDTLYLQSQAAGEKSPA
jgi:predicted GNAT family acetyltransferase